jgi:hypothetical protein
MPKSLKIIQIKERSYPYKKLKIIQKFKMIIYLRIKSHKEWRLNIQILGVITHKTIKLIIHRLKIFNLIIISMKKQAIIKIVSQILITKN